MPKYAIKITPEILPLCEFIQGGPIPMILEKDNPYFIINTDPDLKYHMGVVPEKGLAKSDLPYHVLKM
jgi:hypothetical protein